MTSRLRSDMRLVNTPDAQLTLRMPEVLHQRIDRLCDLAFEAGERKRPTKQEMVAALLFSSPVEGAELRAILSQFGQATVGDALPWEQTGEGAVIKMTPRKSGPREGRRRQ